MKKYYYLNLLTTAKTADGEPYYLYVGNYGNKAFLTPHEDFGDELFFDSPEEAWESFRELTREDYANELAPGEYVKEIDLEYVQL